MEEIQSVMRGWKSTVQEVDGLTGSAILKMSITSLEVLVNSIFYRGQVPQSWKTMVITLTPKDGDRQHATNWRPIATSSGLQCLLHSVFARRLEASVELHPAQEGYSKMDGTLVKVI